MNTHAACQIMYYLTPEITQICTSLNPNALNIIRMRCLHDELPMGYSLNLTKPRSLYCADEELRPVGVWASIRHGQLSGTSVLELEVLIRKSTGVTRNVL